MLQNQLLRVNKEIDNCAISDTKKLDELNKMRSSLIKALLENVRQLAVSNNLLGAGDVAQAAMIEGGLLTFVGCSYTVKNIYE